MMKTSGVAISAGLASALLFIVSAKGTAAATLIAYFTALPIMIAALGYGHLSGLAGALIGSGAVAVAIGPILGAFFALVFALPGWWLSYLALLARPAALEPTQAGRPPSAAPGLLWYPIDRVVIWGAVLASGAVLVMGGALLLHFGGYRSTLTVLTARLESFLDFPARESGLEPAQFAALVVKILPPAMAASAFLMLMLNLWLGGRISELSERLRRPWPNVPDGLLLPRPFAATVLFGFLPIFVGGPMAIASAAIAAACSMAFALQGLAAAHVLTRGFGARRAILAAIYIVTIFAMPWPLVALTLLGLVDCLFSLRSRRIPTIPNKSKGDTPWK